MLYTPTSLKAEPVHKVKNALPLPFSKTRKGIYYFVEEDGEFKVKVYEEKQERTVFTLSDRIIAGQV